MKQIQEDRESVMPYKTVKQNCTRSDGKKGKYILKYKPKKATKKKKDSEGFVKAGCHTSKKNADGQRAAIEAGKDIKGRVLSSGTMRMTESEIRKIVRKVLLSEELDIELVKSLMNHANPDELESAIGDFIGGDEKPPEETAEDLTTMLQDNPEAIEAALEDEDSPIMDVFKNVAAEDEDLMASFREKIAGEEETDKKPEGTTGTTTTESFLRITRAQIRNIIREAISKSSEDEGEDEDESQDLDEREYGSVDVSTGSGPNNGAKNFYKDKGGPAGNPRTW